MLHLYPSEKNQCNKFKIHSILPDFKFPLNIHKQPLNEFIKYINSMEIEKPMRFCLIVFTFDLIIQTQFPKSVNEKNAALLFFFLS